MTVRSKAIFLAVLTPFIFMISSCGGMKVGETSEECEMRGADKLCIRGEYLGLNSMRINVSWTYAEDKFYDGSFIHKIEWTAKVSCSDSSGALEDLTPIDKYGQLVTLSDTDYNQMWFGIKNNQLAKITENACSNG